MLNEVHRINLRVTENTPKGDERIKLLEGLRLLALQEKKEWDIYDGKLVWWALDKAGEGYAMMKAREREVLEIKEKLRKTP